MGNNRPWLPFLLSVLLHVVVLLGPGWELPDLKPAPPLIAARLVAARTEAAPVLRREPPVRVGPRASAPRKPAVAVAPENPEASLPVAVVESPVAGNGAEPGLDSGLPVADAARRREGEAPTEAAVGEGKFPASVDTTNWPQRGEIHYALLLGRFEVGRAAHAWRHDGDRYEIRSQMETTGIVALGRNIKVAESSVGAVTAAGLRPTEYRLEREGRPAESVHFDRSAGVLRQEGPSGSKERELASDSQDLLSLYYQMGFLAASHSEMRLSIATARHYGNLAIIRVGEAQAETRLGPLRLLHFKTELPSRDQAVEVWLAVDYRSAPVRIRFVDHKGDAYELQAVSLQMDGARLVRPTPPPGFQVN